MQPGADGGEQGRTPNAIIRMIRVTGMVQRITRALPPRLTNLQATAGPPFLFPFEPFTFDFLASVAAGFGSLLAAIADLDLPFADPAFLGLAAFGSVVGLVVGLATSSTSAVLVGVGGTDSGSGRSCAGASLLKATPSSRKPAPEGSVATTPSGGPSSFQASAASSSSLTSPSPAMIASAIRPAFCRTAASILAATSGFSLRNCLAFSRP